MKKSQPNVHLCISHSSYNISIKILILILEVAWSDFCSKIFFSKRMLTSGAAVFKTRKKKKNQMCRGQCEYIEYMQ